MRIVIWFQKKLLISSISRENSSEVNNGWLVGNASNPTFDTASCILVSLENTCDSFDAGTVKISVETSKAPCSSTDICRVSRKLFITERIFSAFCILPRSCAFSSLSVASLVSSSVSLSLRRSR